jgi:uncharacterized protein YbjQ (UPF0145 family)
VGLDEERGERLLQEAGACRTPQVASAKESACPTVAIEGRFDESASSTQHAETRIMIISNTQEIPGKRIVEFYGVVSGSTVRAKHIGRDIAAGFKNIVGGELRGYTELLSEARGEAIRRMSQQAQEQGANAIVNVRFATSSVAQGAAELFAYGTAVRVE